MKKIITAFLIYIVMTAMLPAYATADSTPEKEYEAMLDSADNYIKRERWDDAVRCIRKTLSMRPGSPLNSKLFCNLGICLTNTGDYPDAIEAFNLALVREPESPSILSSRAVAYLLDSKPEMAKRDLDIVVEKDSLDSRALRIHGQLSLMNSDLEAARRDFMTLRRNFPADSWGPAGLAEYYIATSSNSSAIPLLHEAIALDDNPDFRISLIEVFLAENRLADAEEAIRESIGKYPREGMFYLLRGALHQTLYQNNDAELDKKLALEYGVDPLTVEKIMKSGRK